MRISLHNSITLKSNTKMKIAATFLLLQQRDHYTTILKVTCLYRHYTERQVFSTERGSYIFLISVLYLVPYHWPPPVNHFSFIQPAIAAYWSIICLFLVQNKVNHVRYDKYENTLPVVTTNCEPLTEKISRCIYHYVRNGLTSLYYLKGTGVGVLKHSPASKHSTVF